MTITKGGAQRSNAQVIILPESSTAAEISYKDMNFFVSGSVGNTGTSGSLKEGTQGTAVFGGDMVVSGTLHVGGEDFHTLLGEGSAAKTGGTISGSIHHTTGGLKYIVGTGASTVSYAANGQITINTPAAAANAFSTIDVNDSDSGFSWGSSNVVADATTDTLKLVAGTGVTLASDASNDAIRITSTATGGNTLDQAYDQGGAGVGAIVLVDTYPVQLRQGNNPTVSLVVTGSAYFGYVSNEAPYTGHLPPHPGLDVTFYVSGAAGRMGDAIAADAGTATFTGDTVISGVLKVGGPRFHERTTPGKEAIGGTISGSIHHTSGGLSYLVAGSNVTITSASNGQVTIASSGGGGGSSQWTDNSGILHPADSSGAQTVVIGGTGAGSADILFGADGAAVFNKQKGDVDFRVATDVKEAGILVDGGTDQVVVLGGGVNAAASYGTNAATSVLPTDIAFFVSGACDSAGKIGTYGTAVMGGDLVVSGAFRVINWCAPNGQKTGIGINPPPPDEELNAANSSNLDVYDTAGAQINIVRSDTSTSTGDLLGSLVWASVDNANATTSDAPAMISVYASENHTAGTGGAAMYVAGQPLGSNNVNHWLQMNAANTDPGNTNVPATNSFVPLVTVGQYATDGDTLVQRANLRVTGHIYGTSPVSITASGSFDPASNLNHVGLIVSGTMFASGSYDSKPYGTISGSIQQTRDGLSYIVAGNNVTVTSASNGQVTIASTGGGGSTNTFATIDVNDSDSGFNWGSSDVVADSSTDTLKLIAGTNITLASDASNDAIRITASGGGGMTSFQLEDDRANEVTISNAKEVKFYGAVGIKTQWTDTSDGTDGDPYDMAITTTGSVSTALYSCDGPHRFAQRGASNLKSDVNDASAINDDPVGKVIRFAYDSAKPEATTIRSTVPHGATKVRFEMMIRGNSASNKVTELRMAGRLLTNKGTGTAQSAAMSLHNNGNSQNTSGHWLDSNQDLGWRKFKAANSNGVSLANPDYIVITSDTYNISDMINTNDAANGYTGAGDVIDYAIMRNSAGEQGDEIGTSQDTLTNHLYLAYVKVIYDIQ
jgi:hypothetical protein